MHELLLSVEGLGVRHGAVPAVEAVSFGLTAGESVALIGANGAGKSSLLRAIAGLLRPVAGRIVFAGHPLPGDARVHALAGIGYAPEGRRPFPGLSVRENLDVAGAGSRRERAARLAWAFELFPPLAARADSLGWQLSGGEAQMLAIARALMGNPRLLLLDEPSLGLAPRIVAVLIERLRAITSGGTALLVAEEQAATALALCDRVLVLRRGRIVDAAPAAAFDEAKLRQAYFGT